MKDLTTEQKITKVGVWSLAALAAIGIIASFFAACGIDPDVLCCKFIEQLFMMVLLTLFILVGFCFPVSFIMNFSSIAASLKENRKEEE